MHTKSIYNEKDLLLLIAAGDKQAYGQLFDRYYDRVYATGLHISKSPELAKDFAQDVFLKLWNNRAKLPRIDNFAGWLVTITKNLVHDHWRNNVFRESNRQYLLTYFARNEITPCERLERKELSGVLDEAIRQLPPQLYQVFTLSRLEGLSHEEIGRKLKISPLSSKTYMTRALTTLRKQMVKHSGAALLLIAACLLRLLSF